MLLESFVDEMLYLVKEQVSLNSVKKNEDLLEVLNSTEDEILNALKEKYNQETAINLLNKWTKTHNDAQDPYENACIIAGIKIGYTLAKLLDW